MLVVSQEAGTVEVFNNLLFDYINKECDDETKGATESILQQALRAHTLLKTGHTVDTFYRLVDHLFFR